MTGIWLVDGFFGNLPGGLKAVDLGHHHIHQDQVRYFRLGNLDPFRAIPGGQDLMPMLFKEFGETQRLGRRVVDNQYAGHAATPEMISRGFPRGGVRLRKR